MKSKVKNFICLAGFALSAALAMGVSALPVSAAMTEANAALVLPASYEQYLALEAPQDIAFSERRIAIADGDRLYLYDSESGEYSCSSLGETRKISAIGFAGERLFIADTGAGNSFYEYDFGLGQARRIDAINCSAFCIDGGRLYTATVGSGSTTIARYEIDELDSPTHPLRLLGSVDNRNTPAMTVLDGVLYCTFGAQVYYPDPDTEMFGERSFWLASDPSLVANVQSVCAFGGSLFYTADGGLYRTDLAGNAACILERKGLSALAERGGFLYAVEGDSVKEIKVGEEGASFTDYEISAASASENRLSGGVDGVRAGNLLLTADAGNRRISVAELGKSEDGNFLRSAYTVPCVGEDGQPYVPSLVATDGELIAVASENYIYLYHYGESAPFLCHVADTTNVKGLVCVYGSCYYVTEYGYGKAEAGAKAFPRSGNAPKALCADVYGTIYVVGAAGDVQSYSETAFADPLTARGTNLDVSLPEEFTSLRADFEGNLYCLSDGGFYKNGELCFSFRELPEAQQFVYGSEELPVSFALGYEDDEVFFLFGNYYVRTDPGMADIPTLSEIDASGVREEVFRPHGRENILVDVPAGSVGIRTDLDALGEGASVFPYQTYYRTAEDCRGILLAVKGRYSLVVLYDVTETSRVFTANLFRLDGGLVPPEEYWREGGTEMYLSSGVSAYYFPCLYPALGGTRLERGEKVTVYGYVEAPERSYALVGWNSPKSASEGGMSEGDTFGYVPVSYLTSIAPIPKEDSAYEPAYLKANKQGVEFVSEDGEKLSVFERVRADFFRNEDGSYTARFTGDGKLGREGVVYTATVSESMIDRGESDALRISLIVILSVLAVGIVGGYIYLLPNKRTDGKFEE